MLLTGRDHRPISCTHGVAVGTLLTRTGREIDRLTARLSQSAGDVPGQQEQRDLVILSSLPGVDRIVLATLLAEAHDPLRRRDNQALRCLSAVAPVTRRSGKSVFVVRRLAAHNCPQNAVYHWTNVALQHDSTSKSNPLRADTQISLQMVGSPSPV